MREGIGLFAARLVAGEVLYVVSLDDGALCAMSIDQYVDLPTDVADRCWWAFELDAAVRMSERVKRQREARA